jgi:hypothetical protein
VKVENDKPGEKVESSPDDKAAIQSLRVEIAFIRARLTVAEATLFGIANLLSTLQTKK